MFKKTLILTILFFGIFLAKVEAKPAAESQNTEAESQKQTIKELKEKVDALEDQVDTLSDQVEGTHEGLFKYFLGGTGSAGYTFKEGKGSTVSATFSPHFYFLLGHRAFFEAHVDFKVNNKDVDVNLEFADFLYIVSDDVTLGAGKFLTPFSFFLERIHTSWINKLPDKPFVFSDSQGLAPESTLGAQFRGAVPIKSTKLNYAVFVGNGPSLNFGTDNPNEAGMLDWDNFTDFKNSLAVGARIGVMPIPDLEIGGSFIWAKVATPNTPVTDIDAFLLDFNLTYTPSIPKIKGNLQLLMEMVRSQVDSVDFGQGAFNNTRYGSYFQLSYRPLLVKNKVIKNFELVSRYDRLDQPSGAPQLSTQGFTFGLNYVIMPSVILKTAYQLTKEKGMDSKNAFLSQIAVGF